MTSKARNRKMSPRTSEDEERSGGGTLETGASPQGIRTYRAETPILPATQDEVAHYIEGLTGNLRRMAQAAGLDTLAYFLEMARLEASIQGERLSRRGAEAGEAVER
jgi:hypothetical protein